MTNNTFISINPASMTKFIKKSEITSKWYEIDANNAVVGRLATVVSKILRGKNKATYTPHMDTGDFVIVKNIEKIKFTGSKFQNKKYYKHTGYPGGIKEITPEKRISITPETTKNLIFPSSFPLLLPNIYIRKKELKGTTCM